MVLLAVGGFDAIHLPMEFNDIDLCLRLEELGFAERRAHPGDRRKHAVHLTAAGQRTLERARVVAIETAKQIFSPLSSSEVNTLRELLRKLAGVVD